MQGGGRPVKEIWKNSNIYGKIQLVAFIIAWLWFFSASLMPFPHALERIRLNVVDPSALSNMMKEPVGKQKIQCPIQNMVLAPNGKLLLLFYNGDLRLDRRYHSGLILVMENGVPQYTLEFDKILGFDLWFDDDGLMCIEDGRGYGIERYSIEGVYEASQDGNRGKAVNHTYWDKLTAPNGTQYELCREPNHQWVVMTDTTGTRRVIYEVRPEIFARRTVQKVLFLSLFLFGLFGEVMFAFIGKCVKMAKEDWACHQEMKARIEKEKKSGKSIWR